MAKAVGIDLGTTNSVVAVLEGGEPAVIPNAEGSRTTPSVVALSKTGEVLVGEVAKRQAVTNPDRTVRSVKRHMGESSWRFRADSKEFSAQQVSAFILHVVLVGGSTRMPMVVEFVKQLTVGKEPHKGVNPDEVVAVGATLQAGVLKGEVKDILLLDVTPLSLGIETKGGVMTKLIERNTTIPTRRSEVFTTADDGQSEVDVKVFQGEREMTYGNKMLGNFQLVGIPPAPRGVPQIEVTFDIDANGIVNVSAKDRGTSKEQSMTITGGTALPKEDIDRMVREAEQYAEEDRRRREAAEAKNRAEQIVYQTEKSLKDYGDKISDEDRSSVERALADLKEKLTGDDTVAITSATETLQQASYKLAEAVYAQASGPGQAQAQAGTEAGPDAATGPSPADGDVVDAEIIDEGDQD